MKRTSRYWSGSSLPALGLVALGVPLAGDAQQAEQDAAQPAAAPPPEAIEEVVVVGRLKSSAFDVVSERIEQEVVTDFLGADEIARTGDSTVSLALRRMPGLSLVNDQFVYVRGLGERYSSVLLNGAQVPSPDLTRSVLPLDIFPTEIIDALAVQKGYSADMPAAFGGGNVNIVTLGIPDNPVATFKIQSGWNFDSDGDGLSYAGGGDDNFGTDDGTRALPAAIDAAIQQYAGDISATGIFQGLSRDSGPHEFSEALAINRQLATSLYRDIDLGDKSLNPDAGIEASLGNSWYFGDTELWQFGALGQFSYDNTWRNRERTNRSVLNPDEEFAETLRTVNQISATGVLNMGLSFSEDHEISTSSFFIRNTEDEGSVTTGHDFNFIRADGRRFRNYRIRFEERTLNSNQIRGSHTIGPDTTDLLPFLDIGILEDLTYDWYYSDSTAETDIPSEILVSAQDALDLVNGSLLSTEVRRSGSSADYRYTGLQDQVESYGWDLGKTFSSANMDVEVSGGWDYTRKARDYLRTQLSLGTTALAALPALQGTPGQVLSDSNILDPANGFQMNIGGIGTESYLAAQTVEGAYLKADFMLAETWRIVAGARWEQFVQTSLPIDQHQFNVNVGQLAVPADDLASLVFMQDEVYPSLSATWIADGFWAETFQLRFGVSQTVGRPDLREISESTYIDPLTEARIRGAAGLKTSAIDNFDLRAEWFFSSGDNFTVSLFYKDIADPIETVQGAGTDDNISLTFVNAQGAKITGVELEWLKDLAFLGERWGEWVEPFFISGNVTLSDSELVVGDVGLNLTNNERPMSQHSEYSANLQIGFDSFDARHSWSLVYNTFGERLFFAGRDGASDAYERPFDSLDFVYSWYPTDRLTLKFRFQNILDEAIEIQQLTQDGMSVTTLEQSVSTTAKIDLRWDFGG